MGGVRYVDRGRMVGRLDWRWWPDSRCREAPRVSLKRAQQGQLVGAPHDGATHHSGPNRIGVAGWVEGPDEDFCRRRVRHFMERIPN